MAENLIFPATDAGANETFLQPTAGDEEADRARKNENTPLLDGSAFGENGKQGHVHDHSHGHQHHGGGLDKDDRKKKDNYVLRRLKIATALCLTFMLVEIIGGLLSGSLAVLSDAAHLMADLASFAVAIVAAHLAARPSTVDHTFGLKRVESLAALFSMACLAVVSVWLAVEAFQRIYSLAMITDSETEREGVDGKLMSFIATIGVLVNIALAAVLGENHVHMPGGSHEGLDHSHEGHDHSHEGHDPHHEHDHHTISPSSDNDKNNLKQNSEHLHADEVLTPDDNKEPKKNVNLQAAYLHVMADLAQSVAVLIAGLIIWVFPTWEIVDPIATILFCILVFYSTLGVIRSSVAVLLEEVPPSISWQTVHTSIQNLPGVTGVHDLHIWSISHGISAMSVHVHTTDANVDVGETIRGIAQIGSENGIQHSTAQVQPYSSAKNGTECIACKFSNEGQDCVASKV